VTFAHTNTPVVIVSSRLAGLAIMRSLGPLGVPLYGVDGDPNAPALRSRYCRERFVLPFSEDRPQPYVDGLMAIGAKLGRRSILVATSDETTQLIADHAGILREHFMFQDNSPTLVRQLASKREMFGLALEHGIPTPATVFPQSIDDVHRYLEHGAFPVMLKGIYGNRLEMRTRKKMVVVDNPEALLAAYREMEDPEQPNLMLQEYIPGGDDQVYIFNGYFNRSSDCLLGFTGYKIRQFPVHVGCASLGECRWIEEVADLTTRFMKAVGYQGILDIGYRLDPRDGRYKVLDINPRIGQAFRLFVAKNNHDVIRSLYLDFTGQPQPVVEQRPGRRWLIEDFDLISSYHYYREGTLDFRSWVRSFRGVEEGAWFSWRDPAPVALMIRSLAKRVFGRMKKQMAPVAKEALRAAVPLGLRKRAAVAVQRQSWLGPRRQWWAVELVRDLAARDVNAYHQFLWAHHLGYAESYEPAARFGSENVKGSRRMFFADLRARLGEIGVAPGQIRSVLEVGCSLGYQLREMETELFPNATTLDGIDIDEYAIETGKTHLRNLGSKIVLRCADMRDLDATLGDKRYDLIVCTGVLMYLRDQGAAEVVGAMLRRGRMVALAGLAHPAIDNAQLRESDVRTTDNTFIHNLDGMIETAGGRVAARRWEGERIVDGNTVYFVFATSPLQPLADAIANPAAARTLNPIRSDVH
jgi:D-aspartate ligase